MRPLGIWAWAVLVLLGGCTGTTASERFDKRLGPARGVLYDCFDAMGGLDRWQPVETIAAIAVVTVYDAAGQGTVTQQHHVLDLRGGVIRATVALPGGGRAARAAEKDFTDQLARPPAAPSLEWCLAKTLRGVRGPLNLCGYGGLRPGQPHRVRISGMELIRVPALPDGRGGAGEIAYYFDAQTCLLKLVTAGADEPGGEGTVTEYTWRTLPNGLTFPAHLRVVRVGQDVLAGDRPLVDVQYQAVKFEAGGR